MRDKALGSPMATRLTSPITSRTSDLKPQFKWPYLEEGFLDPWGWLGALAAHLLHILVLCPALVTLHCIIHSTLKLAFDKLSTVILAPSTIAGTWLTLNQYFLNDWGNWRYFKSRHTWISTLTLLVPSFRSVGNLVNRFMTQSPELENTDISPTCMVVLSILD